MIARTCDACQAPIPDGPFVELTARVLVTSEDQDQDEIHQWSGDYCDPCIANGKAIGDLLSGRPVKRSG